MSNISLPCRNALSINVLIENRATKESGFGTIWPLAIVSLIENGKTVGVNHENPTV